MPKPEVKSGASEIGASLALMARSCPWKFHKKYPIPPWELWNLVPAPKKDPAHRKWVGVPKIHQTRAQDTGEPQKAAFIGTLVHEGLAFWMQDRNADIPSALRAICEPYGGIGGGLFSAGIPQSWVDSAMETLQAVFTDDPFPAEEWEALAAETSLWAPVGFRNLPHNQRCDLILRNRITDKIYILDWKNTSSWEKSKDPALWGLSPQFQGFAELALANYGARFGGILVGHIDLTRDRTYRGFEVHPFLVTDEFKLFPQIAAAMEEIKYNPQRRAYVEEICRPYGKQCEFYQQCYTMTYSPSSLERNLG
jgi:hypothetical protein